MSNYICHRCGSSNPGDSLYCRNCGELLNQPDTYRGESAGNNDQWENQTTEKPGIRLDSSNPFPDKVSKLKIVEWIFAAAVFILVFIEVPNHDFSAKLFFAVLFSLPFAVMFHFTVIHFWAGVQSIKLDGQKYALPYPINKELLAQKIVCPLQNMEMNIQINDGITGGLFIWCGHLRYKVDIRSDKGYFNVSGPSGRIYLSTYVCMVNDIPKIVYTIQQAMMIYAK